MNYYLLKDSTIAFDNNLVINYEDNNLVEDVCLDENGFKLYKALNSKKVVIQDGTLKVGRSTLRLLNAKPPKLIEDYSNELELDLGVIKQAYKYVAQNDHRPILRGIYIANDGGIVATDGLKLFSYNFGSFDKGIVISQELCKEIIKYNGFAKVEFNEYNARFTIGNVKISGRLYVGSYPNVSKLLSITGDTFKVDLEELKTKLSYGNYIDGNNKVVKLGNDIITIRDASESNIYEDKFELGVDGFTLSYDALKTTTTVFSSCDIVYHSNVAPILFKDEKTQVILLPMEL